MNLNPLAVEQNDILQAQCPTAYALLSERGRKLYYPKGILTQSAEAKEKAHKFNATIGIATEGGVPMHLPSLAKYFPEIGPGDSFNYAPAGGRPDLRAAWKKKMLAENPSLAGKEISLPVVTAALTHGLSLVGDLFVDPGDVLLLPNMFWGNYSYTYSVRLGAAIRNYNTFTESGGFDVPAMAAALKEVAAEKGKAILLLNFPNNPSGYTITEPEAEAILAAVVETADTGAKVLVVCDDAYFGLFYEDCLKESLFARLVGRHPNVLSVRLDGATKELFVWGFRVGCITFGCDCQCDCGCAEAYEALVKKTMGAIRGNISNCCNLTQTLVLRALRDPALPAERQQKFDVMQARALKVKKVLNSGKYDDAWTYYPFNSGYFMCLHLKTVDAEKLRVHVLDKYGVGAISSGPTDLRIAFSCLEVGQIQEVFDILYQGVKDLA